eukprot:m.199067 g.199067  ORF g.199067 m.199067 type:complete len:1326 (+) comp32720_c0_seq1:176-4153(+)
MELEELDVFFEQVAPIYPCPTVIEPDGDSWRNKERKMKTLNIGIVLCFNIGVDPPDIVKPNPCSKLLCWFDPSNVEPTKATETIGARLTEQYKRWQPKIKCKHALDPTFDEVRRMCSSLRRRAKDEPVLFHFNGLGVPRPTSNGELWVFNRNYTQYLPFSVYDLQSWINGPSVFVFDCNSAGTVVTNFITFAHQRKQEASRRGSTNAPAPPASNVDFVEQCILLGACDVDEMLPTLPELPADLFTSCLTTPIKTSLQWTYASGRKHMLVKLRPEMIEHTPGQLNDRRTMLGQLNWIFTAITDTIAWNVLPRDLFHKLFRNDLLVAALFRNFLLAARIMRSYGCTPVSHPALPNTCDHPLWEAWDMASDMCVTQLPAILAGDAEFQSIPFFSDQLTAFEVWLSMQPEDSGTEDPPEQLPIVLQVLLSQQHRLRALELLERFLSLGPWAVRKALSVGIFPYVFKLLGSPAQDLRPVLISLWAKILAEDPKCKLDLLKSSATPVRNGRQGSTATWKAFTYFVTTVADTEAEPQLRAMAAFVISVFVDNHPKGQDACIENRFIERAIPQLQYEHEELRVWLCMALGRTWSRNAVGRAIAIENGAVAELRALLLDVVPKVRAIAVFALAQLLPDMAAMGGPPSRSSSSSQFILSQHAPTELDHQNYIGNIGMTLLGCHEDGSHAVRAEMAAALATLVSLFHMDFVSAAATRANRTEVTPDSKQTEIRRILKALMFLATDPVHLVSAPASRALRSIGLKSIVPHGDSRMKQKPPLYTKTSDPKDSGHPRMSAVAATTGTTPISLASPVKHTQGWESLNSESTSDPFQVQSVGSLTNSYVWQKPRVGEEHNPIQQSIDDVVESIAVVLSHTADDSLDIDVDLKNLHKQIVRATENSGELKLELERIGWSAAEFVNADLERYKELRSGLREVVAPVEAAHDTFFKEWYCEALHSWKTTTDRATTDVNDQADLREWRADRYHAVKGAALEASVQATKSQSKLKLNNTIFHTPTEEVTDFVIFHPTEPVLILANKTSSNIYVWHTEDLKKICMFNNCNRGEASLTSMKLVNEHDVPLLAIGTNDGFVKLWSNFTEHGCTPKLVTGWRAVPKLREAQGLPAGLVLDWNQSLGKMYASGDVEYIQIWDAATESRFQKIPSRISSCVTSMCVNTGDSGLLSVGFGNGNVCLFDPRIGPDQALVQKYEQHKSWIVNVHLQRISQNHVISGSRMGDILWWDPRFPGQAVRNLQAFKLKNKDSMTTMAVHDYTSVLAAATPNQFIKVFNLDGELLNHQKYYTNFLGEPIGSNSCLGFHPFKPRLATGSLEKIVSVYGPSLR